MKKLGDLLGASAAPYRKALLRKKALIDAIELAARIRLGGKAVSLYETKARIQASPIRKSEIFSKKEKIRELFERATGERMPELY